MNCEMIFSLVKFIELFPVYVAGFGAIALLYVTMKEVKKSRDDSKKRAMLEFLYDEYKDDTLINNRQEYFRIFRLVKEPATLLTKKSPLNLDAHVLREFLNRREFISNAIISGVLCEDTARYMVGQSFVSEWMYLKSSFRNFGI